MEADYGVWSFDMEPHRRAKLIESAMELEGEPPLQRPSPRNLNPRYVYLPLMPRGSSFENGLQIMNKRVAEYAFELTKNASNLSASKLGQVIQQDEIMRNIIGYSKDVDKMAVVDLVQACIGAYIYHKILLSEKPYVKLCRIDWVYNLGMWLQDKLQWIESIQNLLRLLLHTAMSLKIMLDGPDERNRWDFKWPRSGELFDGSYMVTWSPMPATSPVTVALTFAVFRRSADNGSEDQNKDKDADKDKTQDMEPPVRWPATIISYSRLRTPEADKGEEIRRLRHLLTSDRKVWVPVQSSSILANRDWNGFPL